MLEYLPSHGLQHARPPCLTPTPGVYSNSCPLSQWCHPTISSSVIPFSCLQSFPASGSFQMSQFFASDGQSTGVSASVSVLLMNIQDWFSWGWTGWLSLLSKGLSRVFFNTTVQKHQFKAVYCRLLLQVTDSSLPVSKVGLLPYRTAVRNKGVWNWFCKPRVKRVSLVMALVGCVYASPNQLHETPANTMVLLEHA